MILLYVFCSKLEKHLQSTLALELNTWSPPTDMATLQNRKWRSPDHTRKRRRTEARESTDGNSGGREGGNNGLVEANGLDDDWCMSIMKWRDEVVKDGRPNNTLNKFQFEIVMICARLTPSSLHRHMAEPILDTPVPSRDGSLRLNCLIEGESIVFVVTMKHDDVVSDLKKVVQSERALGALKHVGPHTLELWKVSAIEESLREITLLFSAQGPQPYPCGARRHSG